MHIQRTKQNVAFGRRALTPKLRHVGEGPSCSSFNSYTNNKHIDHVNNNNNINVHIHV